MTLKKKVEALEAEIAELKKKSCSCNHCPTCGRSFVPYWPYGWTYYVYPNSYPYQSLGEYTHISYSGLVQSEPYISTISSTTSAGLNGLDGLQGQQNLGGMTSGSIQ